MAHLICFYADAEQSGKSTCAKFLIEEGYEHVAFASPLKAMVHALLVDAGVPAPSRFVWGREKNEPIHQLGGVTARHLMQTLGTEWGRNIDVNFWVNLGYQRIDRLLQSGQNVVVDDARFTNEAAALRERGCQFVKVVRPGVKPTHGHSSEGGLSNWAADDVVVNDGTVGQLRHRVEAVKHNWFTASIPLFGV